MTYLARYGQLGRKVVRMIAMVEATKHPIPQTEVVTLFFNGGDGGGIVIIGGRVRKIPPWTPNILAELRASRALFNASQLNKDPTISQDLRAVATRISTRIVPQIAKSIEAPEGAILTFVDGGNGLTSSSTGHLGELFSVPGREIGMG